MDVFIVGQNESDATRLAREIAALGYTPTVDPRRAPVIACSSPWLAMWFKKHTKLHVHLSLDHDARPPCRP
jgi:hypothetical protein